jgi:hypothetical protein
MAIEQGHFNIGYLLAAVDHTANQFKAVKLVAGAINLTTVAGEPCLGILQDTPLANQPANVAVIGATKAKAGAAVATSVRVMAGADGRIITAATTGSTCIGWSTEAAAAANNIFSIILFPAGIV